MTMKINDLESIEELEKLDFLPLSEQWLALGSSPKILERLQGNPIKIAASSKEWERKVQLIKLLKKLNSETFQLSKEASIELEKMGERAKEIIPDLIKIMKKTLQFEPDEKTEKENRHSRHYAALLLVALSPEEKSIIPVLAQGTKSSQKEIQLRSLTRLGEYGIKAKSCLPVLLPLLHNEDSEIASIAAQTLKKVKG